METERGLLHGARRFQERALACIYDRYSPDLFRYAVRLVGDTELAEECVAETFSRFLRALHDGGGPRRHLRAYLYRVAHNWVSDYYRRRSPAVLPLEISLPASEDEQPLSTTERQLEAERLRAALTLLTSDQRQVVALKFLEGWENEEIADALGKSVGAVKSLQHRALAALRRTLLAEEVRS